MSLPEDSVLRSIVVVRGKRVVLDEDLARVYGVLTRRLNEAVKRNRGRFPADFAFRLTAPEATYLKSQFATSSLEPSSSTGVKSSLARRANTSYGGRRKLPWALTEHGALMAANVLNSRRAVAMSVHVVRAFVAMRERVAADTVILKRLAEIDATLLAHDGALREIWRQIEPLLTPPPEPAPRRIGFDVRDAGAPGTSAAS
jgi:hypothetical protein